MRQHHALGAACRPAGVEQSEQGLRIVHRLGQSAIVSLREARIANGNLPFRAKIRLRQREVAHESARLCVAQRFVELGNGIAGIERNRDHAEAAAGERQLHELQAVGKQEREPVAGDESLGDEEPRQALDADG